MNQLMKALQMGRITPAQYEMMMKQMEMNGVMTRGIDTPQERDFLMQQGLLGGGQQPMSPATMPQAPEPTMPMSPMPSAEPSQMQMSPMPLGGGETTYDQNYNPISGRGAPTQNETDFLGQFVDNAKKAMYR
jgi:hypothetical protein